MKLDKNIKLILKILQENGEGYIVGGFIRDTLLGLESKDCDFVTDIEYDKLLNIFKEYYPKEIGKHFGIIQIKIEGVHYEIAKMRQDKGIPKDRKEQEIEFTKNIYEDLKRRDFTINAIAYDGKEFYYGDENSKKDIEEKILRFVGVCKRRIEEDPLRILRYFRFLSTKDLKYLIEDIEEISKYSQLIKELSSERVREELNKIIVGKNAHIILEILANEGILEIIIPEWKEYREDKEKSDDIFHFLSEADSDLIVRLVILFYNLEQMVKKIMIRLRYDKKSIEVVYKLIEYQVIPKELDEVIFIKKMMNQLEYEDIQRYFKILKAKKKANNLEQIERLEKIFQNIIEKQLPVKIKDLKITGKDLLENGIVAGKTVGEILNYLLEKILEYPEYNSKEKLLELAHNYLDMKLVKKNFKIKTELNS